MAPRTPAPVQAQLTFQLVAPAASVPALWPSSAPPTAPPFTPRQLAAHHCSPLTVPPSPRPH